MTLADARPRAVAARTVSAVLALLLGLPVRLPPALATHNNRVVDVPAGAGLAI
jgi:hypothetical protein